MAALSAAFSLLGGIMGAGFASGREIVSFFGVHGSAAFAAAAAALLTLLALFLRLPARMRTLHASSLSHLCVCALGRCLGRLCGALFFLLFAITGGAMLAACAELGALMLPLHHAYGLVLAFSLLAAAPLSMLGLRGVAVPGALLALLFPVLLARLLALPRGEACFLPAASGILAAANGVAYGALSAAQLAGLLGQLASFDARTRRRAALLFALLFSGMLTLGVLVCQRHLSAVLHQPLPFVYLSRALGSSGYTLVGAALYAAAFSTLCAMLRAMTAALPGSASQRMLLSAALCLLFAGIGFSELIGRGYPVLGALCAGLLLVLCTAVPQKASISVR